MKTVSIKYNKKRGFRIKNYGFLWIELEPDHIFDYEYYFSLNNWFNSNDPKVNSTMSFSTGEDCHSLKAAIRKVKKANVKKGTKFILVSRYIGYNIEITKL